LITAALGLWGGNIIHNETYVSPGSVVTGNAGIVIDGKSVGGSTAGNTQYVKKRVPCQIATLTLEGPDTEVIVKKGRSRCYIAVPEGVRVNVSNGGIRVSYTEDEAGPIRLKTEEVGTIRFASEGGVRVEDTFERLAVEFPEEGSVVTKKIGTLKVHSGDDLSLVCGHVDRLILHVGGDASVVVGNADAKIQKEIKGDLTLVKGR